MGEPLACWAGTNFWSRAGGPRMWTRYDGAVVRDELAVLAEHGLNVTRSFCYWPDFVPEPGQLHEQAAASFGDFLDAHAECGLGTIPTVIVGHMSGENRDPAWRHGRDLVAGEPSSRAYLPVEAAGAGVLAVDAAGRPALLRHRLGPGCTMLCTYPMEHMAARTAWANPKSTWRIYSALALEAGASRPVRVADPRVVVGRVKAGASERALFLNCSGRPVAVEPILEDAVSLSDDRSRFGLEPFGVTACRYEIAADDVGVGELVLERPVAVAAGEGGDADG